MRKRGFRKRKYVRCYRCGNKSRLFRCKHCGNYYCGICSEPKMSLTAEMVFNEKDPVLSRLYEDEWRKEGHACIPYGEWKLNEIRKREEELNKKILETLDKMKKIKPRYPKYKPYTKYPRGIRPPRFSSPPTRRKIPVKPIVTIIILIIIGLFLYYNFEEVSETITSYAFSTFVTNCSDGTLYNECSQDKPFYCSDGTLIKNASSCGCPSDYKVEGNDCKKIQRCNDETVYGECSIQKPFYCSNGTLVKKASLCGCPTDEIAQGDICISRFLIGPKEQTLNYVFRGTTSTIKFTVYAGLNDYLAELSRYYYCDPECPSDADLELKFINDDKQKEYLIELVNVIKSKMDIKDNQARIAISLVQKIPYDNVIANLYERYPYEVIYDNAGVCGEKSKLLAFILRELGYGVVLFSFEEENHMSVGIECPMQYSYKSTGFCFIETSVPSIATDTRGDYVDVGRLTSMPNIITVSDGISFESVSEEYHDAQEWNNIYEISESLGGFLDPYNYNRWTYLVNKYGIEVAEESQTDQETKVIIIPYVS